MTEKILQGIPPTVGICDAKDRGEDENMIGDATEKSVRIGGGDVTEKILQGIPPRSGIRDAKDRGNQISGDQRMQMNHKDKPKKAK